MFFCLVEAALLPECRLLGATAIGGLQRGIRCTARKESRPRATGVSPSYAGKEMWGAVASLTPGPGRPQEGPAL